MSHIVFPYRGRFSFHVDALLSPRQYSLACFRIRRQFAQNRWRNNCGNSQNHTKGTTKWRSLPSPVNTAISLEVRSNRHSSHHCCRKNYVDTHGK